jgi:hypothetical protein
MLSSYNCGIENQLIRVDKAIGIGWKNYLHSCQESYKTL